MPNENKGSVISGMFWMLLISLLLFWLPFVGPLIGGIVGGKKAGNIENALLAVFLPAIIVGTLLFVFSSVLTGAPLIGFVAAAGGFILVITSVGPMLLGAVIGAILG